MILVATFVVCLVLGVPIIATIGMATMVPMWVRGDIPLTMVGQVLYTGVDQFPLIAVSGFLLAGTLMEQAKLTDDIVAVADRLVGWLKGGLAAVTILACMLFAALSGSGPATTAAIGSLAIPAMVRQGYRPDFAAATAASGGVLGILIPPSNPMIIYAIIANLSVGAMFAAGVLPGVLVGVLMIVAALTTVRLRKLHEKTEHFSAMAMLQAAWRAKWALLGPIVVLGGIYGGVFTPTEAAEIAVMYALLIGLLVKRSLNLLKIHAAMIRTALLSGTVIVIVGIAVAFGRLLAMYQIPQTVGQWVSGVSTNPYTVMWLITLLLIIVGTFMETLTQVIILTPVFMPLVRQLGIDPVQFGVLFVICCEIGFLTPPVGANLYVATQLSGVPIDRLSVAVLPYIFALIAAIAVIIYFPAISLWLPRLYGM